MNLSLCNQLIALFIFNQFLEFVAGIGIKTVQIPNYGVKGESLTFNCDFEFQESEKLLFLKWYKEDNEIFRYVPSALQQKVAFLQDGVLVDISESNSSKLVLRNISFSTSGNYKCEGMVETTFQTSTAKGYVAVIAPPSSKPIISGLLPKLAVGDKISGNCTLYGSKPAAMLSLYINDAPPLQRIDLTEFTPTTRGDGLEDSTLGFDFITQPIHFINGILSLKCTATIGNLYWVSIMNSTDFNKSALLVSGDKNSPDSLNSHGKGTHNHSAFIILLIWTIIST